MKYFNQYSISRFCVKRLFCTFQNRASLVEITKSTLNRLLQDKCISSTDSINIHIDLASKNSSEYVVGNALLELTKKLENSKSPTQATNASEVISEIKIIRKKRIKELKQKQAPTRSQSDELRSIGIKWFELGVLNKNPNSICALGIMFLF